MRTPQWLSALVVVVGLALHAGTTAAAPEAGWWWNPLENGRGFFIESQNGILFMGGYFYESDGRPTWVVAGGPNADPYSYDGRLLAVRNGQTLYGEYDPPDPPTDAGPFSLRFADDSHGTLTWPGGVIPLQRHRFGGPPVPAQADTGWWWNADESGRGYSIEVQGDNLFFVGFMYDDAGNPVWYLSAGKMESPGTFEGDLVRVSGGQTMTGPYHPPAAIATIGRLGIEFTAIDEATLTVSDDPKAPAGRARPLAGREKVIVVKRQFPAKPTYDPASRYAGSFHFKSVSNIAVSGYSDTTTVDVKGSLSWQTDLELPDLPKPGGLRRPSWTYGVVGSPAPRVAVTYTHTSTDADSTCEGTFTDTLSVSDNASTLQVNVYATYAGKISLVSFSTNYGWTCRFSDGKTETVNKQADITVEFGLSGKAIVGGFDGKPKPLKQGPFVTVTLDWTFAAIAP